MGFERKGQIPRCVIHVPPEHGAVRCHWHFLLLFLNPAGEGSGKVRGIQIFNVCIGRTKCGLLQKACYFVGPCEVQFISFNGR